MSMIGVLGNQNRLSRIKRMGLNRSKKKVKKFLKGKN